MLCFLMLQDSLIELKRQLHKHPSILPVDFDISPTTGELLLNVPSDPIPLQDSYDQGSDPDQNYNYEGHVSKTRVAMKAGEMEPQSNEVCFVCNLNNFANFWGIIVVSEQVKFECLLNDNHI